MINNKKFWDLTLSESVAYVGRLTKAFDFSGKYKFAFTLAEVLITLSIIGIVSVMTIPNLVTNYQKNVTAQNLKKAYAILVNALKMAEAEYGGGKFPLYDTLSNDAPLLDKYNVFETYFAPHIKGAHKYVNNKIVPYYTSYGRESYHVKNNFNKNAWCINNGMCFAFFNHGTNYWVMLVDLNGPDQGPNRVGRDTFYFYMHTNNNGTTIDLIRYANRSIDDLYNYCSTNTNTDWSNGQSCTEIIFRNNWKIPDDGRYPW